MCYDFCMTLRAPLHLTIFTALLFSGISLAQQAAAPATSPAAQNKPAKGAPAQKPADKAETPPPEVPPTAPVITINGLCPDKPAVSSGAATPANCKTVITRAEFEKLASAINPQMPPNMKRQLADVYPRILLLSHEGQKLGLENDDRFKQMLQFATLQLMAQDTARKLNDQASQISDQEIEKYYKDNLPKFERFNLQRIFIPYPEETEGAEKAEKGKPATPPAEQVKAIADKIHARAVAGEDFDKLQKDAFEAVGMKSTAPTTAMDKIPRGSLPAAQDAVFSLKPGAVSDVYSDPGAYYIYKVVSHDTEPLDSVKDEVKKILQNEKLQKSMEAIINSGKTELNDAYFAQAVGAPSRPAPPTVDGKLPPNKSPH